MRTLPPPAFLADPSGPSGRCGTTRPSPAATWRLILTAAAVVRPRHSALRPALPALPALPASLVRLSVVYRGSGRGRCAPVVVIVVVVVVSAVRRVRQRIPSRTALMSTVYAPVQSSLVVGIGSGRSWAERRAKTSFADAQKRDPQCGRDLRKKRMCLGTLRKDGEKATGRLLETRRFV